MEITAPNSTDSNYPRDANRSIGWDSRSSWRARAQWRGKMLKQAQALLLQTQQDLSQALQDYDEIEQELRSWLSYEDGHSPNPNLLVMNHIDLAILADQYRRKYLELMQGGGHRGTAQTLS